MSLTQIDCSVLPLPRLQLKMTQMFLRQCSLDQVRFCSFAFSVLTLFVTPQEEHLSHKIK